MITERQATYVAASLVLRWIEDSRDSAVGADGQLEELVHDGGLNLEDEYFGSDLIENHELMIKKIEDIISEIEELKSKNDG